MDLYVQKFVTISHKKVLGQNCAEIHFAGTNLKFPFLAENENSTMDMVYAIDLKEIKADIDQVKKVAKIVILKTGEPCLQSLALKGLAKHIKAQGLYCGLETYGSKPALIKELLEQHLLDILTIKMYSPLSEEWFKKMNKGSLKTDFKDTIESIKRTLQVVKNVKIRVNIQTIVVPSLLFRKNDIANIAKYAVGLRAPFELVAFRSDGCSGQFLRIKGPSEDFMKEIKDHLTKRFPGIRLS